MKRGLVYWNLQLLLLVTSICTYICVPLDSKVSMSLHYWNIILLLCSVIVFFKYKRKTNYFDFDTDYHTIYQQICTDSVIEKAYTYTGEIHILRQQPWEALCSFIISQNNNIPRITGIIDRLCRQFGEPMKNGVFSFPSPQRLASLHVDDLAGLRAGFRAKYILDAARKITDGTIDIQGIYHSNIDKARKELQKNCGVGPKVADCVLLFGFYRLEAFPVDVWIFCYAPDIFIQNHLFFLLFTLLFSALHDPFEHVEVKRCGDLDILSGSHYLGHALSVHLHKRYRIDDVVITLAY